MQASLALDFPQGVDKHTEVCYNSVKEKIKGGRGGTMGKDIHEVRKYRDEADRNHSGAPISAYGNPEGRQIPLWVQKKIKGATQRRWRKTQEEVYGRKYLGAK